MCNYQRMKKAPGRKGRELQSCRPRIARVCKHFLDHFNFAKILPGTRLQESKIRGIESKSLRPTHTLHSLTRRWCDQGVFGQGVPATFSIG